ncbi:MAG: ABC transporter substrate-binding protein [Candidatus Bathyarchaeia archaeon]
MEGRLMGKNSLKYFAALILALAVLAAPAASNVQAQEMKTLRIAITCPPGTFNLLLSMRDVCLAGTFAYILGEPLVLNLVNGSTVPWLAERWEVLDGGKKYVFHLDKRAKWSDGTPLTALDVEFTWNLTMKYAMPSALAGVLQEVRAVDNYTVEFITTQPWARWSLDFGDSIPLPAHIWSKLEDPLSYDFINEPSKHVTSGPFLYDSFKTGEWWFFRKRANYWKTESTPKIDGIMIRTFSDISVFPLLLQKGEADIAEAYPFYLIPQIVGKPNIAVWYPPGPSGTEVLGINTRLYPLNMKEVRQAIDLAIDKLTIAEFYFMGYGVPGNRSLVNMAAFPEFYVPEAAWQGWGKTHEECVAEANRILDELGFVKGPDGVRVTPNGTRLSFKYILQMSPLTAVRLRTSEAIVDYLKEVGIEVSQYQPLDVMDYFMAAFLAPVKDWGFAEGTYAEYPEPWYNQVYSYLLPPVGLSQVMATGFDVTEPEVAAQISDLAKSALRRLNYAELVEDVKQMIKIYKDYVPSICIAFYPFWIWAYRTDILTNWHPEHSTKTRAFGFPQPSRPLIYNELTPVGWTPPPTPTPTATPTPAVTPSPTPTPAAGMPAEQVLVIAVVVIVVLAIIVYLAVKSRKKKAAG